MFSFLLSFFSTSFISSLIFAFYFFYCFFFSAGAFFVVFPSLIVFTFTRHIKDCNLLIPLFHSHLQYFLNFQFRSFFLKFLLNSGFAYCIVILFLFSKWIRIRIFYDQASIFFNFSISHTIFLYPPFLFILLFIIYASLFYTSSSIIFLLFFLIFWFFVISSHNQLL